MEKEEEDGGRKIESQNNRKFAEISADMSDMYLLVHRLSLLAEICLLRYHASGEIDEEAERRETHW